MKLILYSGKPTWAPMLHQYFSVLVGPVEANSMSYSQSVIGGITNSLTLHRQAYTQHPYPYSDCVVLEDNTLAEDQLPDRSMFELTLQTNYSYSQQWCIQVCRQVWVVNTCGCNDNIHYDILYVVSNTSFCSSTANRCVIRVYHNTSVLADCTRRCPFECSKTIIDVNFMQSYLEYYSLLSHPAVVNFLYAPDVPDGYDLFDYIYYSTVAVDISYGSKGYIAIEEEPKMEWQELLGELSGHLHLFLGMSLLSFFEIGELFVFMFVGLFSPRKQTRSSRDSAVEASTSVEGGEAHHESGNQQAVETNGEIVDMPVIDSKLTPPLQPIKLLSSTDLKETSECAPGTSASFEIVPMTTLHL